MTGTIDLDSLVAPEDLHDITPQFLRHSPGMNSKRIFSIPYYKGCSDIFVGLKVNAISAWMSQAPRIIGRGQMTLRDVGKNYVKLDARTQKFAAYALSHELKVANIALQMAASNQCSSIFEIGTDNGFGALYYGNMASKRVRPDSPAFHLRSYETDEARYTMANQLLGIIKEGHGFDLVPIDIKHCDGVAAVRECCTDGDIVFSSMAEKAACEGLLDISKGKSLRAVVSYSARTAENLGRSLGRPFTDCFGEGYRVTGFDDRSYKSAIPEDVCRYGLVCVPMD